jgi:hypothetical protein
VTIDMRRYEAEYFIPTVRRAFEPLLAGLGFLYVGDFARVTAYWASDDERFLSVGYMPETLPCYEMLLGIGRSALGSFDPPAAADTIGIWRLLPPDEVGTIANWRFDSREALTRELTRAWNEAMVPYVIPVLDEPGSLDRLVNEYRDELTPDDDRRMENRLLHYARGEFNAGRFSKAVSAYDEVADEYLTNADRKRIQIARRRS